MTQNESLMAVGDFRGRSTGEGLNARRATGYRLREPSRKKVLPGIVALTPWREPVCNQHGQPFGEETMPSYKITGLEDATIAKDRSKFDIRFRTNKGKVTMSVSAAHLDALITTLQGLEYHASLLDPKKGQLPGEQALIRAEIVDSFNIGNAVFNNVPSVLLGLKSAQVFRWFALNEMKATEISQAVVAEIPKLRPQQSHH